MVKDLFLTSLLSWYLLTQQEWDSLSADAQHRLIDRYTTATEEF